MNENENKQAQTTIPIQQDFISMSLSQDINYIGMVNTKGSTKNFGILEPDRRKHIYILGKTGMGKSSLLENLVLQDIFKGNGICFVDPHGDSSDYIVKRIPKDRIKDLVYFNPADVDNVLGFNVLEGNNNEPDHLIVSGLLQIFEHIWQGSWSSRMEYILSNTLFALVEQKNATLLDVIRMLTDNGYREFIVNKIVNPTVKAFWTKEFVQFNDKYRTEAIAPILNKIGQLFLSPMTLNILGQKKSTLNLRQIMDNKKILIINLSKGRIGDTNMSILGSLLIGKLQLAAMSRSDTLEKDRTDFYVYIDEFQNFTTDSFATILSEARKYRLCLTIAHQYIKQLEETKNTKVKNAIFGNVGTTIVFGVGFEDAYFLSKEFAPIFTQATLVNLNKFEIAIRLSINGKSSAPFLAKTLGPIFDHAPQHDLSLLDQSSYTVAKQKVEDDIRAWMQVEYKPKQDLKKFKNKNRTQDLTNLSNALTKSHLNDLDVNPFVKIKDNSSPRVKNLNNKALQDLKVLKGLKKNVSDNQSVLKNLIKTEIEELNKLQDL
jgi:Type IV secretion-system coupling protein DNA-binding domain